MGTGKTDEFRKDAVRIALISLAWNASESGEEKRSVVGIGARALFSPVLSASKRTAWKNRKRGPSASISSIR